MNKKIISLITFFSLSCLASFASAQITNPIKYNDFTSLITQGILPAVAGIVGSLATVMIIVAGILYLTSAGSPERIGTAKKALIYAIVGIVIAIAADSIANIITGIIGAH